MSPWSSEPGLSFPLLTKRKNKFSKNEIFAEMVTYSAKVGNLSKLTLAGKMATWLQGSCVQSASKYSAPLFKQRQTVYTYKSLRKHVI